MEPRRYSHLNLCYIVYVITWLEETHFKKNVQGYFPAPESFGQLVPLGFDITAFTPVAYQRRRLQRPLKETSS